MQFHLLSPVRNVIVHWSCHGVGFEVSFTVCLERFTLMCLVLLFDDFLNCFHSSFIRFPPIASLFVCICSSKDSVHLLSPVSTCFWTLALYWIFDNSLSSLVFTLVCHANPKAFCLLPFDVIKSYFYGTWEHTP